MARTPADGPGWAGWRLGWAEADRASGLGPKGKDKNSLVSEITSRVKKKLENLDNSFIARKLLWKSQKFQENFQRDIGT
jgi:hypothetical protein